MSQNVLTLDRIKIQPGGITREQAIDEAAQLLIDAGAVTEAYGQAMRAREESVSTFMGNGLAIPHGTNDAKDEIRESAMSFTRYEQPVSWGGEDVNFVVGIAGKGDEHLEILQKIAILFSDDDAVAQLRDAATVEDLNALLSAV